ncbi:MAG: bifunctional proline dehydrogenase/L-glutamate gamma-semialdehyde dehydrogenase PutA [Hyphomicrobiales bacterium]
MPNVSKPFPKRDEKSALKYLLKKSTISDDLRDRITTRAIELVERIREDSRPGIMELFLGEYGLSSDEGIALMCLAEALLRVPDGATMDALIEDKIAPSAWGHHLGQSHSSLVNASTWALYVTGKVLNDKEESSIAKTLHGAVKRLGEPVIRQAVTRVMKEMGRQFVLGETIEKAIKRAEEKEQEGFTYSYDMLGEAACTDRDARRFHLAYSDAIGEIAKSAKSDDIRENPGISIKLSALHPRYETMNHKRVMEELAPRARSLAVLAKSAGIGLNIDAEEAGRLEISIDVIEAIFADPVFNGWDGFGVVVQAYSKAAPHVLDRLYKMAEKYDRRIMVRLVKGAYWDTEIKHAQVEGHSDFPVYTRKSATDVSYICCAQKLLGMTDRIYPQFATHNAHTVAAILEMADDKTAFEFQRLHGMGEALHDTVLRRQKTRCRIYAPVGAHRDLLAYLVRRLLENGANSSFVNQIVDENVPASDVAADPFAHVLPILSDPHNPIIKKPADLFQPSRENSMGFDLEDPETLATLDKAISKFHKKTWSFENGSGEWITISNPATGTETGQVRFASMQDVQQSCQDIAPWQTSSPKVRADILRKIADLYEANAHEIFALLMREAGKTLLDCVGELREAVDFLRFYAAEGEKKDEQAVGVFTCIAPWNFPLAIYTGQIAAALAAGNGVLSKPAEATPLIASFATELMWQAGVPRDVLKLIVGHGHDVGSALVANSKVDGVCFTGSTATAKRIDQTMAANLSPAAPLIAETGGLNAMIVDSTALPEQAVKDVVASAFQSAGQRCSALRVLYLQEDIADGFLTMLFGAMDELKLGDPTAFETDIGPVIDEKAASKIRNHIETARNQGRILKEVSAPEQSQFIPPTVLQVGSISDLAEEIFGPVLHIATYKASELDAVIDAINATGFGLTFGLHSRIDDRVQHIIDRVEAGNLYINRNQIGAVVGSQPFGGEGLSGTGPKAGGPRYLNRFLEQSSARTLEATRQELPGPTGESNQYSLKPRGRVACLGPTPEMAQEQKRKAEAIGCEAVVINVDALSQDNNVDAVISWSSKVDELTAIRQALAARDGKIVWLLTNVDFEEWLFVERHVCIDTTAAGGNAALLGGEAA